jgi:hypothetical protein
MAEMNQEKKSWQKTMDKIMLDCDTATLLITKSEFTRLSCKEQIQLKMHLWSCKFCRRFKKQSEFISYTLKQAALPEKEGMKLHLTEEQKQRIKKKLKKA